MDLDRSIQQGSDYLKDFQVFLWREYGIKTLAIVPAKRGYYGETWRLKTVDSCYFAKLDYFSHHQKIFQKSLPVVDYLCENGIDFINKIVKTKRGNLHSFFKSAVVGVFEWIDGDNVENDDTKEMEYQMLCQIYPLTKPGLDIPVATFSNEMALRFFTEWGKVKDALQVDKNRMVDQLFERHRQMLQHCATRLHDVSLLCQKDNDYFYITHGDAGGNFLITKEKPYIVDWDEVMVAPLERDAWVMCCHDWARKLFDDTLKKNNIPYQLRLERLAFYCYHMFFFYLGEFLEGHKVYDKSARIEDYLTDSWITERIRFAEEIC